MICYCDVEGNSNMNMVTIKSQALKQWPIHHLQYNLWLAFQSFYLLKANRLKLKHQETDLRYTKSFAIWLIDLNLSMIN